VGAVVVSDASLSVLGILSERDVVRVLAKHGASALDDPVSRYMTPKVITATRDDTIDHAMQTMTAGRFRHIPVVRGPLIGIVSIGAYIVVKPSRLAVDSDGTLDACTRPDGDDADQAAPLHDRDMPKTSCRHRLHGVVDGVVAASR